MTDEPLPTDDYANELTCANVRCLTDHYCTMQEDDVTSELVAVCVPYQTLGQPCGQTRAGDEGECAANLECSCGEPDCAADAPRHCVEADVHPTDSETDTCDTVRCDEDHQCVLQLTSQGMEANCVPFRQENETCGETMIGDFGLCAAGMSCSCVGDCASPLLSDMPMTCVVDDTTTTTRSDSTVVASTTTTAASRTDAAADGPVCCQAMTAACTFLSIPAFLWVLRTRLSSMYLFFTKVVGVVAERGMYLCTRICLRC